jgi:hypothetical protein
MAGWLHQPPAGWAATPQILAAHYVLALNEDPQLCQNLRVLYDKLLEDLDERDRRSKLIGEAFLTDFAATQPSSFRQIGLVAPPFISEMDDVRFYSVIYDKDQQPRTLALKTNYISNDPTTDIAIFKAGVGPRLGTPSDVLGPSLPVRPEDVGLQISFSSLVRSQEGSSPVVDVYLLKKWPSFSRLLSAFEARHYNSPLPAIGGGGLTIRPFLNSGGSLYFIYDQYGSIHEIRRQRSGSNGTVIVLVQRLDNGLLHDVCYLVISPSQLAATVESDHVGK